MDCKDAAAAVVEKAQSEALPFYITLLFTHYGYPHFDHASGTLSKAPWETGGSEGGPPGAVGTATLDMGEAFPDITVDLVILATGDIAMRYLEPHGGAPASLWWTELTKTECAGILGGHIFQGVEEPFSGEVDWVALPTSTPISVDAVHGRADFLQSLRETWDKIGP
jgi:hypothetical protein